MGQAFRRAAGRIPTSSSSSSSKVKTSVDRRPPVVPVHETKISSTAQFDGRDQSSNDENPQVNADNVLEKKDPKYDAMLNQMLGRIQTKPGGKLEMGEASVVERYDRPMPKLRNTNTDTSRYEERPVQPGTLNVAQLRHMMLLYQGKADDHDGPMDVQQIAKSFRLDVKQVQTILQFLSLPPEDSSTKQKTLGDGN